MRPTGERAARDVNLFSSDSSDSERGASGAEPAPTRRRATDVHDGTPSPAVGVRDGTPVDPDGLHQVPGQVGGAITHTSSCCASL